MKFFIPFNSSLPSRKFRIGINSELIRTIPNYSDICIWANANQSEPIRETFCISFVEKRLKIIRLNPSLLSEWIRSKFFNLSESESIRTRMDFHPNESVFGLIRIHSDWIYGLNKSVFGLIMIHSDLKFTSHSFG